MNVRTGLLALVLGLAGAACVGLNVGESGGCAEACARARDCGFLPSALGWSEDEDLVAATADCERRCGNSPRSEPTVSALIECLNGEQRSSLWCDDPESESFARWEGCAGIDECLATIVEQGPSLVGAASLSVALISFTDYANDFASTDAPDLDLTVVAELYGAPTGVGVPVRSCQAALCSPALCGASEVDRPCDDTLCRKSTPAATQACSSMAIERMLLLARQPDKMQVRLTLFDAEAEAATSCSKSTSAELTAVDYGLGPGPVELAVQVTGTLAAGALRAIGYPGADKAFAADPMATMPYCLQYAGPSLLLRAGSNSAVIPVGDITELIAAGLDASILGDCPM